MCTSNGSNGDGPDSDKQFMRKSTEFLMVMAEQTLSVTRQSLSATKKGILLGLFLALPGGIAAVQPAWAVLTELRVYVGTLLLEENLSQPAKDELDILEKRIERSGKRMLQHSAIAPNALLSDKIVHQHADQLIAWKVRSDLSDRLVRQELSLRLKELNASVEGRRPARGKHATYTNLLAEQDRLEQYTMAVLIVTLQKLDAPQELYAEYQRRHFT